MTTSTPKEAPGESKEPVPHADVGAALAEVTEEFGAEALKPFGGPFKSPHAAVRRLVGSFA
ncbi:hypothetical protein KKD81_00225 [Patescibacteria group bacterium]|nr:hypothetical protein [Patescibacteria group bacterium]MBU2158660.1 hypothetical protein [Patescibacteria group bacterium]MBU2220345.1 hypothetical protein [Patescibacteria group bacterium]